MLSRSLNTGTTTDRSGMRQGLAAGKPRLSPMQRQYAQVQRPVKPKPLENSRERTTPSMAKSSVVALTSVPAEDLQVGLTPALAGGSPMSMHSDVGLRVAQPNLRFHVFGSTQFFEYPFERVGVVVMDHQPAALALALRDFDTGAEFVGKLAFQGCDVGIGIVRFRLARGSGQLCEAHRLFQFPHRPTLVGRFFGQCDGTRGGQRQQCARVA